MLGKDQMKFDTSSTRILDMHYPPLERKRSLYSWEQRFMIMPLVPGYMLFLNWEPSWLHFHITASSSILGGAKLDLGQDCCCFGSQMYVGGLLQDQGISGLGLHGGVPEEIC